MSEPADGVRQSARASDLDITRSKRVAIVSINRGPSDPRAMHKEGRSLAALGYDVTYVCNAASGPPVTDQHVHIDAISFPSSRLRLQALGPTIALREALRFRPDAVHVLDAALAGPALRAGRRHGIKVVVDLPEDTPRQILQKEYLGPMAVRRVVSQVYRLVVHRLLPQADLVVAATPSIAASLPARCHSVLVRNFPAVADIDAAVPLDLDGSGSALPSIRVAYVGGISAIRGISQLVAAVGMLGGRVELHLAGPADSEAYLSELRSMPGWRYCRYHGWLGWQDSISLVKACDAGACIMQDAPNQTEALPVKVFEYMACSKPSVVSFFPLWRRLFAGAALFADPASPPSAARQLEQLLSRPALARRLAERGRVLAERDYSWEHEAEELGRAYAGLWSRGDGS